MKRIAYIGGQIPPPTTSIWGGSIATNNAYLKAFEGDPEYYIDILPRCDIDNAEHVKQFCEGADIVHLDDTGVCGMMYQSGLPTPDIIGPITRSPVKGYKLRGGGLWQCPYPRDWFYKAEVIRLNYQEERKNKEDVRLVVHGVDTESLVPTSNERTLILWAGQATRWAKNYGLWEEICETPEPEGYDYFTMTGFAVQDYWENLDYAAVYVCTSLFESFCSAAFEAMAKGVPVVWQNGLQGGLWEDAGIRCELTAEGFTAAIKQAINDPEAGRTARKYVEDHCTLRHMRDSYAQVFEDILNAKKI